MIGKIAKMIVRPRMVLGVLGAAALACYVAEHRDTLIEVATNVKTGISDKIEGIKHELNNVKKCTEVEVENSGTVNEPAEVSSVGKIDNETGVESEVGTTGGASVDTEVSKSVSDSEKVIAENIIHHLDRAVSMCRGVMHVLHKNYGVGVFTDSESSTDDTTDGSADDDMTGDIADVNTTDGMTDVDNSSQQEVPTENEVDDGV